MKVSNNSLLHLQLRRAWRKHPGEYRRRSVRTEIDVYDGETLVELVEERDDEGFDDVMKDFDYKSEKWALQAALRWLAERKG